MRRDCNPYGNVHVRGEIANTLEGKAYYPWETKRQHLILRNAGIAYASNTGGYDYAEKQYMPIPERYS